MSTSGRKLTTEKVKVAFSKLSLIGQEQSLVKMYPAQFGCDFLDMQLSKLSPDMDMLIWYLFQPVPVCIPDGFFGRLTPK
jgi:hypothetical protein